MSAQDVTVASPAAPDPAGDAYTWAKKRIDRASKAHTVRCGRYRQREDAWLATRKRMTDPPKIRFAYQRMDVLLSYITSEKPVGRVAPLHSDQKCIDAAALMDKALNVWRRRDQRDLKQYEWMLTALVYGVAPAKSYWAYDRVQETYRSPIVDPTTNEPSGIEEKQRWVDVRNQPSFLPLNPYDFAWDPAARESDLSDAQYVCYWSYPSLRNVRALDVANAKDGAGIYHNTSEISEMVPRDVRQQSNRRGQQRDLTGHVELCEVWTRDRLVVIANNMTCIRDEENPFQHHELPFVIGTTMPNLTGSIETSSEVELIAGIQDDLWMIAKELRANMRLANKLITLFNGTVSDPEKIINALRGDDQFVAIPIDPDSDTAPITWSPTTQLLAAGFDGIKFYGQQMDDMSGIGPLISGDAEDQVDPKTATEIQTLQTSGMRRINKVRAMLYCALERASNLELKLARQFFDKPLEIRIEGNDPDADLPGDEWSFDFVDPTAVMDADLEYVIRDVDEQLDQQQKRTEANNRLTMTLTTAQVAVALNQGAPNVQKAFEDFIEAYGEDDPSQWWLAPPPPQPVAPLGAPPGAAPQGAGGSFGASPPVAPTPPLGGPALAAPSLAQLAMNGAGQQ